jgi:hypothetical protein
MNRFPVSPSPPAARQFDERWEDVRNSAFLTKRGSNDKPDYDFTNLGLLLPQNDATEKVYISDQTSHKWAGSDGRETVWRPHIHYIQDEAQIPVFKLSYRVYNNGAAIPGFTTIATSDEGGGLVFDYAGTPLLQIIEFPHITLSGFYSSAWYDMILWREDNTAAGDVLVKGFDWHQLENGLGSRREYVK